jgi:nicotinamide-nucleotide amidase
MALGSITRILARRLAASGHKLVLCESCTGGLGAAALARIPGISAHLCGSMVAYRNETKQAWLGIDAATLRRPGPVSEKVARQMVDSVFEQTPEATLAAAVTGHLGPDAPERLDGTVFVAVKACREPRRDGPTETIVRRLKLDDVGRAARQQLAAEELFRLVVDTLG